jgi:hypothetical protein
MVEENPHREKEAQTREQGPNIGFPYRPIDVCHNLLPHLAGHHTCSVETAPAGLIEARSVRKRNRQRIAAHARRLRGWMMRRTDSFPNISEIEAHEALSRLLRFAHKLERAFTWAQVQPPNRRTSPLETE